MIISYDVDFNFIYSDVSVELIKCVYNVYNSKKPSMALPFEEELISTNTPFLGIPILNSITYLNSSIAIGHNFRKLDNKPNELDIEAFPYCLKTSCYVNLPKFTFCTIIIKDNCNKAYKLLKLNLSQKELDISKEFDDSNPKYISLYSSDINSFLPVFMNQKSKKIYIEHICSKKCKNCISRLKNEYECIFFNPDIILYNY
ncbi:hypothetical protein C1646_726324 [Rhizophagus diaphanus]|nr:hypothetical protein C1646_726324 [Rhizophagus diaphanus] [Rhizophagus sp. MUCL 43196]